MLKSKNMNINLKPIRSLWHRRLAATSRFCGLMAALLLLGAQPICADVELADAPLLTKVNPPPTNLMILQDDSGSMTFEILVKGQYDGQFPNPDSTATQGYCYVFDNMADGVNYTDEWRYLGQEGRKYWRSQWHAVNVV